MSTVSEAMKELIRQQLLTLHTCLICKVLRVYSDGTAKVHPLTMVQTRSGEVHQHQVLDGVPIADQVKSTIRVGCVCVVVFAERDIAKALTGDYALPSLARHHSLSDGLIVGTIGETPGETIPGTQWYAPLSAETSTAKTTVKDSKADAGKEIYVDVKCDPAEDNLLYATSDGLYAPGYTKAEIDSKIDQKSHVTVFPHQTTGTKIATITVDETTYDVYAPQVPSQEQIDAWTSAAEQAHTHANKDVLDEITAAYTTEEQEKLSGIEDGANKYVHPTHTAHATGFYKIANDAQGHLTAAESVTKSDITELGVPGNNTTYTLTSDINTSSYHKIILTGSDGTKNAVNVDNVVQDKIPHSSVGTDLEYCLTASSKINGNGGRRVGSVYVAQELVYGIKNRVPYVRISPGSQKGVTSGAVKSGFASSEIGGFVNDVGFYGGSESTNPYLYALNGSGLNTFFKAKNSSSTSYETPLIFTIFGQNTKYYEKIFGNSDPLYDGEITVESPIALASMAAKYKHENAEGYEYKNSNIENINITFYGYIDSDVIYTFSRNGTFSAPKLSSANATQSEQGLMSAADKAKLDEIEIGANKITVDTALSSTSTNPVQNKAIKAALDGKAASNHTHSQYYNTTISRTANTVLAAPNGSAGSATFRKLVASDIPDLSGIYLPKNGTASSATKLATARKINGIAFDGTGDIQIPLRCARAYTNTNPSSAPWFKVASWTSSTNAYSSSEISFYVIEGRGSSSTEIGGILRAKIRQGNTPGVTESVSLTWLYATGGIDPDNYVATYTNNSDAGTVTLDLWVKLNGTYHSSGLYVLGTYKDVYPSSYEWTLYNSTSGSATYAGDGSVVSKLAATQNPQSDTGWVSITLGSMFSGSSWLKCRKIGKAVHLQGELCPASAGIPGYNLMLSTNLPYPPDTTRTFYPINKSGKPMQIQLSAGSGITIFSPESGYTTDSNWIIDTTYFTEE